jgi:hypothetical protein
MPWGTLCHFYQTVDDLLDILIPYFSTEQARVAGGKAGRSPTLLRTAVPQGGSQSVSIWLD